MSGEACVAPPLPCDPSGAEADPDALPRVARCEQGRIVYRDVLAPTLATIDVPETTDLAQGAGPRFVVKLSPANARVVQVLLDELGEVQATIALD
jgi:hypothetical protein